jgi:hypothetical protein
MQGNLMISLPDPGQPIIVPALISLLSFKFLDTYVGRNFCFIRLRMVGSSAGGKGKQN